MMIFRRYGTSYQSVDIDFDAKALNDVGFRRNRERSEPVENFERVHAAIETVELTAEAEGPVQYETKQVLLDRLRDKLEALAGRLPDGGILVVENESGHDYPKTRQVTKNVIEGGENRLYFEYTMAPPLRVTLYGPPTGA
jgi:hypothetical protein